MPESRDSQLFESARVFNGDYRTFYADRLNDGHSIAEAEIVWRVGGLAKGATVLDLGCGHGRIANRLAAMGASVVGLDLSMPFVAEASLDAKRSGCPANYVRADMRRVPFAGSFDAVICWYTSFGYFDDDDNRAVLVEILHLLRPGGRFVLDLNKLDATATPFIPSVTVERGDQIMVEQIRFDRASKRINARRIVVDGDAVRQARYSVRLFGEQEIAAWLGDAGFVDIEVANGAAFDSESRRFVITANKSR